jgi:hypothetical protein
MLHDLDDPEMTNGASAYAALIGLIIHQGLELRASLPAHEEARLATFTTELTANNMGQFQAFLASLPRNHEASAAMANIRDIGAATAANTRQVRRQEAKILLTYLITQTNMPRPKPYWESRRRGSAQMIPPLV